MQPKETIMSDQFVIPPQPIVGLPVNGLDASFPVRRVYCVGRNYAAHAREMGFDPAPRPDVASTKVREIGLNTCPFIVE